MKFTRLTVLALVLALMVCAFVACGGGADTEAPDTNAPDTNAPDTDAPDTDAPDTNAPDTDPIETEHVHDIEVEIFEPTCVARGYKREICKTCEELISVVPIPEIDHVAKEGVNCDTDVVCKYCETLITAAPGHTFGEAVITEATCEAEGERTRTCTVCGEKTTEVIPKKAHVIATATDSKPATLREAGYVKGTCSLCNKEQTNEIIGLFEDFENRTGLSNDEWNNNSVFAGDDVEISNSLALGDQLVTENGNTYILKSAKTSNGFYIIDTSADRILTDTVVELAFDYKLISHNNGDAAPNCSVVGFKVGGDDGTTKGTEHRILCNFGGQIRAGVDRGGVLIDNAYGQDWYNIKIRFDTTTFDYKVWLNGQLVAETDHANNVVKYVNSSGEWTSYEPSGDSSKNAYKANKDSDLTSLYLFHNNSKVTFAIDNLSLAVIKPAN